MVNLSDFQVEIACVQYYKIESLFIAGIDIGFIGGYSREEGK